MHFKSANRGNNNDGGRSKSRHTAFYIKEFFRTEVCAEARFRNSVVAHAKRKSGGGNGIAAVRDICERASVNKCGSAFKRLNKVRF